MPVILARYRVRGSPIARRTRRASAPVIV